MSKNEFICDCNIIHQEAVDEVNKDMPEENTFNNLADLFKLIGDTTRCRILFALDEREMCVCDIANVLSMTKSAVSHQLATLRRSGIVTPAYEPRIVRTNEESIITIPFLCFHKCML